MKLWILSDLHLEAVRYPEAFRPEPPGCDTLVVAGDIWEGSGAEAVRLVAYLARGRPAVCVLGNHEFWNSETRRERAAARVAALRHDVTLLDDTEATTGGVRFVGGTLWADGRLAGAEAAPERPTGEPIRVAAHARVRARPETPAGDRPITQADEAALHRRTRAAIGRATQAAGTEKLVVVTHHAPHPSCLPEASRRGWAAGNAASDLSALTDTGRIALWVHGHVHASGDQVRPGGTRIVCNPAGQGFSNAGFREDFVAEV